jgi:CHASE2 domain-containing sensor protein
MLAKLRIWIAVFRRSPLAGSVFITAIVGIVLVSRIPLINSNPLEDLSYDIASSLKPTETVTDAVVVYDDQETLMLLGTDPEGKLNRTYYGRMLDILKMDKAKMVFFDIIFDKPSSIPGADQALASAIRSQGSVILVAGAEDRNEAKLKLTTFFPPIQPLADAARGWGHAEVSENVNRQIPGDFAYLSYAGWVAATNLAPGLQLMDQDSERWLNYYGSAPSDAIRPCWLQDVLSNNVAAGFFSNKLVLVGQDFPYGTIGSSKDTFETPYSRFGSAPSPGVLINATALLNLIRGDWLKRVPRPFQWLGALVWSLASVGLFYALSRNLKFVVAAAILAALALCAGSLYVQWHLHWWWAWAGPAFIQTPLAGLLVLRNPKRDKYIAFISYRNETDGAVALLIQQRLAAHGFRVFIDVESLHVGKFNEQLLEEIESATFFILILSPNSLARCVNEGDWVLKELAHALTKEKKIIPVFREGFRFDAQGIPNLPQISELKNYQGVKYANSDLNGFIVKLKEFLRAQK